MQKEIVLFFYNLTSNSIILETLVYFFAVFLPYLMLLGTLVFLLKFNSLKEKFFAFGFLLLVLILSRGILTEIIRFFLPVSRPFLVLDIKPLIETYSFSFPSGHSAFLFGLSFFIFYFSKKLGVLFLIFSLLNGLARISTGVHWPLDILGGIFIAFLAYFLVLLLVKKYRF